MTPSIPPLQFTFGHHLDKEWGGISAGQATWALELGMGGALLVALATAYLHDLVHVLKGQLRVEPFADADSAPNPPSSTNPTPQASSARGTNPRCTGACSTRGSRSASPSASTAASLGW